MGATGALAATHGRACPNCVAERFVVVGPHGEDRVAMQVTGHGIADIALADAQGRNRAELRGTPEGTAGLGFYNPDGARRLLVGLTGDDRAGVAIYSSEGRQLVAMAARDNGDMSLTLYDPNSGVARTGLGLAADGSPALVMFDKKGKEQTGLSLDRNAKPGLFVADENRQDRHGAVGAGAGIVLRRAIRADAGTVFTIGFVFT
jgi:hypothetical protein